MIKYHVPKGLETFNEAISSEINKETFKKRFNLSGKRINNGVELYTTTSLITLKPNLGPLVILEVTSQNLGVNHLNDVLHLESRNGLTFYVHFYFAMGFALLSFLIYTYQLFANGDEEYAMLLLPGFGFFYALMINFIAESMAKTLVSRIGKILKSEPLDYHKI